MFLFELFGLAKIEKLEAKRDVKRLIKVLRSKKDLVRIKAAQALRRIGDVRAVQLLFIALRDQNSTVRACVAEALGNIGDPRAVPELERMAQGEDRYVFSWHPH